MIVAQKQPARRMVPIAFVSEAHIGYGFFSTRLLPKIKPISAIARGWF
jgi:hypothetical protein